MFGYSLFFYLYLYMRARAREGVWYNIIWQKENN